jgi:hypothetical protein
MEQKNARIKCTFDLPHAHAECEEQLCSLSGESDASGPCVSEFPADGGPGV